MTQLNLSPGCQQLCHAAAPTIDMKRNGEIVMKSKALGLLAAALMGVSGVVGAVPVLVGTTTNPTGIDGLVVDGTTYSVAFSPTTLNTFTPGTSLSTDAANALGTALNALSVVALGGEPSEAFGFYVAVDNTLAGHEDAPYCLTPLFGGVCAAHTWSPGLSLGTALPGLGQHDGIYVEAADFTASPVPVPASIWLILSGLAGWRRGQTAAV